jgi:proteasome-associated ATPase
MTEPTLDQLRGTIKMLEEEIAILRRRLQDAPRRVRVLEERLLEAKGRITQAVSEPKLSVALERPAINLPCCVRGRAHHAQSVRGGHGVSTDALDVMQGPKLHHVEPSIEIKALELGQKCCSTRP